MYVLAITLCLADGWNRSSAHFAFPLPLPPPHQVYDLLDLTNDVLAVKWDAKAKTFVVTDLLPVECRTFDDIITVLAEGYRNRRIGSTALNKESSRSHRCVLACVCSCGWGGGCKCCMLCCVVVLASSLS